MSGLRGDDLAYATLDYIWLHPSEWDQARYMCGTTACFAGRAVLLALDLSDEDEHALWEAVHDDRLAIGQRAAALLGWDRSTARAVFLLYTEDFGDLEAAVKKAIEASHD